MPDSTREWLVKIAVLIAVLTVLAILLAPVVVWLRAGAPKHIPDPPATRQRPDSRGHKVIKS